jgi:membrane-associated protease RseP (regulator of RpoE activity)
MTSQTQEPYERAAARLEAYERIERALGPFVTIERYTWGANGALTIQGQLQRPPEQIYRAIRAAVEPLGFTPFLQHTADGPALVLIPGVLDKRPPRRVLPIVLFVITVLTTLLTGALQEGVDILADPAGIWRGLPFAATLIGILGTHELGHYLVGRWRGAPVSLPYFIPVPPGFGFTGTLGAVIVQREPMEDRRTTIEVGLAGPIAGLIVAIPLLFYGLATSPVGPPPATGYVQEGNSLLYAAAKYLVFGQLLPANGLDVQLGPVAWGAWIGLLVTMLNLMPLGQLDGGHAAYALLGERARYLGYGMVGFCVALGLFIPDNQSWLVWGVLGLLMGARHPPPLNELTGLSRWHIVLAVISLVLFVLLFMPIPLREVLPPS